VVVAVVVMIVAVISNHERKVNEKDYQTHYQGRNKTGFDGLAKGFAQCSRRSKSP